MDLPHTGSPDGLLPPRGTPIKASRRIAQSLRRLAEGSQGIDERAWAAFIGDAYGLLRLAAGRTLRDELLAEDAVQESLLAIWDQVERGRIDPTASDQALLNWCYTVAANRARRLRAAERRRRQTSLEDTAEWEGLDDPTMASADPEVLGRLRSAVGQLPERQRTVVELRFGGSCDNRTIAERMGLAPAAVAVLVHRALDHLRRRLGPGGPGASAAGALLVTELLRQGYGATAVAAAGGAAVASASTAAPAAALPVGGAATATAGGFLGSLGTSWALAVAGTAVLGLGVAGFLRAAATAPAPGTPATALSTTAGSDLPIAAVATAAMANAADRPALVLHAGVAERYARRQVSRDALRLVPSGPARSLPIEDWRWLSRDAAARFGESGRLAWTEGSATAVFVLNGPMDALLAGGGALRFSARLQFPKANYVDFALDGTLTPEVRSLFPDMAKVFRHGRPRPSVNLRTGGHVDSVYNFVPVGDLDDGRIVYECWPEAPFAGCDLMTTPIFPAALHMRQSQVRLIAVTVMPLRIERIAP